MHWKLRRNLINPLNAHSAQRRIAAVLWNQSSMEATGALPPARCDGEASPLSQLPFSNAVREDCPDPPDFDLHTFKCAMCDRVHKVIAAADPEDHGRFDGFPVIRGSPHCPQVVGCREFVVPESRRGGMRLLGLR